MGLDYEYPEDGSKACAKKPMTVKYNGRKYGEIKKVKDGYQFTAIDNSKRPILETIGSVQRDLQGSQPSHTPFNAKKTDGEMSQAEIAALRKEKKKAEADELEASLKLEKANLSLERANVLLAAALELLGKQKDSKVVLNMLEQTCTYDDSECDGFCLMDDIVDALGT